jgi:hypothetical protein
MPLLDRSPATPGVLDASLHSWGNAAVEVHHGLLGAGAPQQAGFDADLAQGEGTTAWVLFQRGAALSNQE